MLFFLKGQYNLDCLRLNPNSAEYKLDEFKQI